MGTVVTSLIYRKTYRHSLPLYQDLHLNLMCFLFVNKMHMEHTKISEFEGQKSIVPYYAP